MTTKEELKLRLFEEIEQIRKNTLKVLEELSNEELENDIEDLVESIMESSVF